MNNNDNSLDLPDPLKNLKFCATCGYESASEDDICPMCNGKMSSLQEEADKIDIDKKSDLFDDEISLDELAEEEVKGEAKDSEQTDEDL